MAIPGLRDKLAPDMDLRLERGSFSRSMTGHNILGRVEVLEDALTVLLTAQVKHQVIDVLPIALTLMVSNRQ